MIQQEAGKQEIIFFFNRVSELLCTEFKATGAGLSWDLLVQVQLNFRSLP